MMAEWEVEVTAFKNTGDEYKFNAIFDRAYQSYGDDPELSGMKPILVCRDEDVSVLKQTHPISIKCMKYQVADTQPDGWGITTLTLKLSNGSR